MNAFSPVPRRREPEQTAVRASALIRADLEALDNDRASAVATAAELEATHSAVLMTGDDKAAEQHEALVASTSRAIARADLRRPSLEHELAQAELQEAAELQARRRTEAEAAVAALVARQAAEYDEPARRIAGFLRDWLTVGEMARAAGIPWLLESRDVEVVPAVPAKVRTEAYTCFLDENGNETMDRYPTDREGRRANSAGVYPGGRPATSREQVTRERVITDVALARPAVTRSVLPLPAAVRLPGVRAEDPPHWPGA